MAVYKENIVDIDLAKGSLHRSFLTHTIGSGDVEADHFGVRVFRDGEPVDLTDVSVQGIFNPPQGSPIALTSGNVISGNVAAVVLKQACYNYNGQFCLSIKLVGGGVTGTMRIVDGVVDNTHSTGTVAPTEEVPTYQEVIAQYDAMVAATAAANGAIAKPYAQLTFPVKKGEYTIVDGALKRALVDIATSETYTAAHWTDAKLGPDLSQLKSALDASLDAVSDTGEMTIAGSLNANMSGGKVTMVSYGRSVYYALTDEKVVTVTKIPGETFSVGFTTVIPVSNVIISNITSKNTDGSITSMVPIGARYLIVYYYNTNKDTVGEATMLASISVTGTYGAIDYTARANSTLGLFKHINPENWYDPSGFADGKLNVDGTVTASDALRYTEYYIPVTAGDNVSYVRGDTFERMYMRRVTAYDKNKTVLPNAGRSTETIFEYTVPDGVSFVRITVDVIDDVERYKPIISVGSSTPSRHTEFFAPYYEVNTALPYIKPEMFGAYGDGYHDDTVALQTAIDLGANRNIPVLLAQTYAITDTVNICGTITGCGTVCLLDKDTRLSGAFLVTTGDTNIHGITIDCKSTVEYTVEDKFDQYNVGIKHSVTGSLVVDGCTFRNIYRNYIIVGTNTKKYVSIINNYFDASNKSNRFMSSCITVSGFIESDSVVSIQGNRFQGYVGTDDTLDNACAILSSNCLIKRFIISGNTMLNMGRLATYEGQVGYSRLCAIDFYFNGQNIIISDNKILECNWTPIRLHGVKNVKISRNEIGIAKYINEPMIWVTDAKNSTGEEPVGVSNIVIDGNTISSITTKHCATVFQINSVPRHATAESSITNVVIRNNTVNNFYSEQLLLADDSLKSCVFENNYIRVSNIQNGVYFPAGDYTETKISIVGNDFDFETGNCINLSSATGVDAEITSNRLNADAGACITGLSNDASIVAIGNILSGSVGIENIKKAIRNISDCSTNYTGVTNLYENFPSS